jgi:hypothetical protein
LFRTLVCDQDRVNGRKLIESGTLYYDLIVGFFLNVGLYAKIDVGDKFDFNHKQAVRTLFEACQEFDDNEVDVFLLQVFGHTSPPIDKQWPLQRGRRSVSSFGFAFIEAMKCHTAERCFLWTTDGYFGLGPRGSEPGDIVCKFISDGPLYLLRKHDKQYEFVGPCFVLGLLDTSPELHQKVMDGEWPL